MATLKIYICIGLQLLNVVYAGVLLHGYSVLIQPDRISAYPGNASFSASNFYSYASSIGYLSFGWWLPAGPHTNTSHCVPDNQNYDFYEYSSGDCGLEECLVHVLNYNTSDPGHPDFEEDYAARTVKVGDEPNASLAVSYFETKNGAYSVGSRSLIGLDGIELGTTEECQKAFSTIEKLHIKYQVPLMFPLENPCADNKELEADDSMLREI